VVARVGAFFLRHPHPRLLDGDVEGVALGRRRDWHATIA
jgi:hypothetical protein